MSELNEWFYIRLALGLTYIVLGVYIARLWRRKSVAESALRETNGGGK